jgi:hypothetical protein
MRTLPSALAILVFIPSLAAAQTTTDEGIRALIRGDYAAAARILRPLAEDAMPPDPVAQFFLAMLYQSGRGVEWNSLRACGLFVNAAKPANPFMRQAAELANAMRDEMGLGAQFCGTEGPWDPGPVYLAPRYTSLEVSRPVVARRHFIEQFIWWPNVPEKPSTWTLRWTLSELVGADYVPVIGERRLWSLVGTAAPVSFNVTGFAGVRVNANGEAEFYVNGNSIRRSGLIPWKDPR